MIPDTALLLLVLVCLRDVVATQRAASPTERANNAASPLVTAGYLPINISPSTVVSQAQLMLGGALIAK
jgi:hypothetical protein